MMGKYWTVGLMLLLAAAVLTGCAHRAAVETTTVSTETTVPEQTQPTQDLQTEGQLMAKAPTREEAQALAEQYGITLLRWHHGIAVFYTEEDPAAVIRRGQEKGWQALSVNHAMGLNGEKASPAEG